MNDVKHGTIGGILCSLLALPWMEIEKAVIISATGALVSYFISILLRRITKNRKDA